MQHPVRDHSADRLFTPVRFGALLALLIFAAFPTVLLGLQTFVLRDFGFFAYPLAHFQRDCFWHGEWPLWNPYNQCGVPFLAQWNTLPLYPLSLIYLLPPLTWGLGIFCLLHLWLAGLGMFFLARRWTGNPFAAAFAGVGFAFNGFTLNLLMWPSHLATFAWMPWVILAVELAWRSGGRHILLAALAGMLQMFAGGPEIIALTWALLLALWFQQCLRPAAGAHAPEDPAPGKALLWRFPLVAGLVVALSAAQLLPFLDLVAHSQRDAGYADFRWSMPGWGWVNFLVPQAFGGTWNAGVFFQHGQAWTSSYYLGLGMVWLAVLALWKTPDRRVRLLGMAAVAGLVLALGDNTPVLPALRQLIPPLGFITYPVKYILLTVFIAPLLAAAALARFFPGSPAPDDAAWSEPTAGSDKKKSGPLLAPLRWLPMGALLLALISGIVGWAWWFPFPGDDPRATLLNGASRAGFLMVTGGALWLLVRPIPSGLIRLAPLLLILTAWFDVFTHVPPQNPTVSPWIYQPGLARTKLALQPQPELGGSRLMVSPGAAHEFIHFASGNPQDNFLAKRIGYCANVNTLDAVPKVDGFFSLTPRESDQVLGLFYRTTNADYPRLEDFMGVSQITASSERLQWQPRKTFLPLLTAGQTPVFLNDAATLEALTQKDFDGGKRVILPESARSLVTVTHPTRAHILSSTFGRQSVDAQVEAAEPSLVVVAQTYYHHWRAFVDGQPVPLLRANGAFQAVPMPAGRHHLHLAYQDRTFQIGMIISAATGLGCLMVGWVLRARPPSLRKNEPGAASLP